MMDVKEVLHLLQYWKNCDKYEKNQKISHFCHEAEVGNKHYELKWVINMVLEIMAHFLKNKNQRENISK